MGRRQIGPTCTRRAREAIARAVQVGKMHLKQSDLEEVLGTTVLAKALYATESVPLAGRELNQLRTVVANCLVPGCATGRSPTLALATARRELDPIVLILGRRAMALRRLLARRPELRTAVLEAREAYARQGTPGTAPPQSGGERMGTG